jgi:hypothetical protein
MQIIILFLCLLQAAFGADFLMVIGAGGESPKVDTIFDSSIGNIGDYAKRTQGIKIDVALDGGDNGAHTKTQAIINDSFPMAATKSEFHSADYRRLIESYKYKLQHDEMVAGDQLMVYINSHGAENLDPNKSHQIATTGASTGDVPAVNLTTLAGIELVDLDDLKEIQKLAKEKHVKMAIVDMSCHSGKSLTLADDNTCVISSTGPKHYGYVASGTFAGDLPNYFIKGNNLEDIFLEARSKDQTSGVPMISTHAGVAVNDIIYEKITPFLYNFSGASNKLTPFLEENNNVFSQCVFDNNYASLIATINTVEKLAISSTTAAWWQFKSNTVDFSNFKILLEKYKVSLDLVRGKIREMGLERLKTEEIFNMSNSYQDYDSNWSKTYTWKELLTFDFERLIEDQQSRLTRTVDPATTVTIQSMISLYTQSKVKKEEILRLHPELGTIHQREMEIQEMIESNNQTTSAIGTEERRLYSELYKSKKSAEPNPCKDFKIH